MTARYCAMHFILEHDKLITIAAVADKLDKHHATVLHGLKEVQNLLETNKTFRETFYQIEHALKYKTKSNLCNYYKRKKVIRNYFFKHKTISK